MALTKVIGAGLGTLTGNADFNGDLDVDGTTNLDVVDIDGAVDMASTLIVKGGDGVTVQTSSDTFLQLKTTGTTANNYIEFKDSGGSAGNFQYNHASNYLATKVNGAEAMRISSIGAVTKPLQPAFSVEKSGNQDNIALNTNVTVTFETERIDANSDFASNTFTAPVTGKYQLNIFLRFNNLDSAAGFYQIKIITSNRNHNVHTYDPRGLDQDISYVNFNGSVLADMDASDTAYIVVYQNNGTQQTDISSGSDTRFSGYLVA
tara:strand:+ start:39 stop:824 length:786 start_codon:yes stop_codon:yes gene_type:complete